MNLFLQQILNGLALGSAYSMFAISFGLVFATMGILSVAHGAIATWGAVSAWWLATRHGVSIIPALLIGIIFGALLATLIDQVAFQPLRSRNNPLGYIITSIGVWIVLINLGETLTENQPQNFPPDYITVGRFVRGTLFLTAGQVWLMIVGVVVVVVLHFTVAHTPLGMRVRAVGFNPRFSSISGVNSRLVAVWTACISGAVAGLVGVLSGSAFDNVSMALGEGLLLKGFAAVVIGGFGDIRGTYIGGLMLGLTEVLAAQYLSGAFRDAISFGLLLAFLVLKPSGLMGEVTFGATR